MEPVQVVLDAKLLKAADTAAKRHKLNRNGCTNHLDDPASAPEVILDVEDGMKDRCAINLHNTVTIPQDRLGRRVANSSNSRMQQVCAVLRFALGCD